jgi:membrane-associated phospholipid phosphatase
VGVPALVGGERRIPERDSGRDREQARDGDGERWGPARADLDARTIAVAAGTLVLVLVASVAVFNLTLSPDRYALLLLAPALAIGRGRRYLLDFLPLAALITVYAECRGIAHLLRPDPYFTPHLDLERWLFAGNVPASVLQDWFWSGRDRLHDTALLSISRIHQIVPLTLAFVLWMRRRALFYRFAATLLVLSFSAAITFLAYPAAPPWHAAEQGLLEVEKIGGTATSRVSKLWTPYDEVHPNPDAAIPSLHAGYAYLVFLFVASMAWHTRWRVPAFCVAGLYVLLQSLAAIYTGNHYVVDLLIGYAYAAAAFVGVSFVWRLLRLPAADRWSRGAPIVSAGAHERGTSPSPTESA